MKIILFLLLAAFTSVSAQPLEGKTLYGYFNEKDVDLSILLYKNGWYLDSSVQHGGYSYLYFVKNHDQKLARVIDPISSGIIQYNYVGEDYQTAANLIVRFFEREGFSLQSRTKSGQIIHAKYANMQRKEMIDIILDPENQAMGATLNNVEF
jgi:hypothetical protein